jgi:hypothetical protein
LDGARRAEGSEQRAHPLLDIHVGYTIVDLSRFTARFYQTRPAQRGELLAERGLTDAGHCLYLTHGPLAVEQCREDH